MDRLTVLSLNAVHQESAETWTIERLASRFGVTVDDIECVLRYYVEPVVKRTADVSLGYWRDDPAQKRANE